MNLNLRRELEIREQVIECMRKNVLSAISDITMAKKEAMTERIMNSTHLYDDCVDLVAYVNALRAVEEEVHTISNEYINALHEKYIEDMNEMYIMEEEVGEDFTCYPADFDNL